MYYVFNYSFNIQLIFNIQRVIQYSTSHSTFNYSFYIQFLIHPIQLSIQQFQPFIQLSTLIFKTFNYSFNIQFYFNIQLFIQHSTIHSTLLSPHYFSSGHRSLLVELFWKNSSYVSGVSICIFVALYVGMFVARANKGEGTMSWCLRTNEILASI